MDVDDNIKPGIVVDEFRCGYIWNREIMRPAKVKVSG
jgi:molecular chaperone GrpE (heat shock protein)